MSNLVSANRYCDEKDCKNVLPKNYPERVTKCKEHHTYIDPRSIPEQCNCVCPYCKYGFIDWNESCSRFCCNCGFVCYCS